MGSYYAVIPRERPNTSSLFSAEMWQSITSHEVFEAATDPDVGVYWPLGFAKGWQIEVDLFHHEEGGDPFSNQFINLPFGAVQKFADNHLATGDVWTLRWDKIGAGFDAVYGGGNSLFAVHSNDHNIYRFDGFPDAWTKVGGPGNMFAANSTTLFGLTPDRQSVWQFTGTPNSWFQIGGPADMLYAGGNSLFAIHPGDHDIYRYEGQPFVWTKVGGPGETFAIGGNTLFGLTPDKQSIWQFTGTPGSWSRVFDYADTLVGNSSTMNAIRLTAIDRGLRSILTRRLL